MDKSWDREDIALFIDDVVSQNFAGLISADEVWALIKQDMVGRLDAAFGGYQVVLPPLNIRYYKPPNETRYKPKLPDFKDLPEDIRFDIAIRKCMHFARCNGKTLTTLKEIERILSDGT